MPALHDGALGLGSLCYTGDAWTALYMTTSASSAPTTDLRCELGCYNGVVPWLYLPLPDGCL
jgi:hypothetical protein